MATYPTLVSNVQTPAPTVNYYTVTSSDNLEITSTMANGATWVQQENGTAIKDYTFTATIDGNAYTGNIIANIGGVEKIITPDGTTGEYTLTNLTDNAILTKLEFKGSGTKTDPYLIESAEDLNRLSLNVNTGNNYLGYYFKQTNDIDLNGATFTAIGTETNPFAGTYDGNDKTISNAIIGNEKLDYQGIFGYVKDTNTEDGITPTIKNLGVNCTINGKTYVGGIVGYNGGTVTDCYNTNVVNGNSNIGGIVGYNCGILENCYNTGEVSGNDYVGGVTGNNYKGTVKDSYSAGIVSGKKEVGEIAGGLSDTTVENCYYNKDVCSVGDTTEGVIGLTSYQMTGQGTGRADEMMTGFDNSTWAFTADDTERQVATYPTLKSNAPNKVTTVNYLTITSDLTIFDNSTSEAITWVIPSKEINFVAYNGDEKYVDQLKFTTVDGTQTLEATEGGVYTLPATDKNITLSIQEKVNTVYTIMSALSNNKSVDIENGSQDSGANTQLYTSNGTRAQRFEFEVLQNGNYKIININSGKVLDVQGAGTENGTNVQQYDDNGSMAQQWILEDAGNGNCFIKSACNGLYLDVTGASTENGTNIQVYEGNGSAAQKFTLNVPVQLEEGTYMITSKLNNNEVIDITGASVDNGANAEIYANNGSKAQQYTFKSLGNGWYTIEANCSGKMLDVAGAGITDGTNVQQYDANCSGAQQWYLQPAGNGYYYIVSACNGLYLDVAGAGIENGTNVQMYTSNTTDAQQFSLEAVNR